jgi:hypothetical protein
VPAADPQDRSELPEYAAADARTGAAASQFAELGSGPAAWPAGQAPLSLGLRP